MSSALCHKVEARFRLPVGSTAAQSSHTMPLLPIHGHTALRARFDDAIRRNALPGSLLLHGPAGVGKQRLALWIGQRLLCAGPEPRPCGTCQQCKFALAATHPDIHWYFPRPRLKDSDASPSKIEDDLREAIIERTRTGAYAPPPPEEGIYVTTIRAISRSASMSPAIAQRKVYIIGDAERMVLRDDAEESAGAFLKLLEEPPERGNIILTTSEPGALIPTIRSRLVAVRVPRLSTEDTNTVLAEPAMQAAIAAAGGPKKLDEQLRIANGVPGALVAGAEWADALERAAKMLDAAARRDKREQARTAMLQGARGARGAFSTALDALTTLLHERVRKAVINGDEARAARISRAMTAVEDAKLRAAGLTNPTLVTSELLRQLERYVA